MVKSRGPGVIQLVTVLYRSERSLPTFLDCLQAQDLLDWRLYVIDNASPDNSLQILNACNDPRVTVIRNDVNLGFSKAANQGMRAAVAENGEFILLTNNDIMFNQDFLSCLIATRSKLSAGVIAPRIMQREQPEISWYAGGSLDYNWVFTNNHHKYDAADRSAFAEVDFAPGCCLGISREVLEQVGLFDESFFVYWEDADFCLRLKEAGVKIFYVPNPFLLHSGGESSGGEYSPAYMRLYYRSYMQILRKHFGFSYAIRTMLRLLSRERSRNVNSIYTVSLIARAMLLGLVAPLVKQVRVTETNDTSDLDARL